MVAKVIKVETAPTILTTFAASFHSEYLRIRDSIFIESEFEFRPGSCSKQ